MRELEAGLRLLTLLFTDTVSSTEQLMRLGANRSDELRRELDDLVWHEIDRAGGSLVKSTGDGCFAAFKAPSEGVSCAIGIQRSLARRNLTATEPVGLRVGLATGEVVVENHDVYGRAANESARITGNAKTGEILCCAVTRQLAAARSSTHMELAGEVLLRGFDAPSSLYRVEWAEVSEPLVPLPGVLAQRAPFVGRAAVLAVASDLWTTTTATRQTQLIIIGGEPGVGKTSVVARLAHDLFNTGASVLYGRCSEQDIESLRPIREALAHYVRARPDTLADELGSGRRELVRLVPELAPVVGSPPATVPDHRVATAAQHDAVVQWLATASRLRPILLVIDDAEWLDRQTATVLHRLVEEVDLGPLLLAVVHRDREPRTTGEVAALSSARRSRDTSARTMRLGGLTSTETAELVRLLRPAAHADVERLHRASGGNPLYLGELLRSHGTVAGERAVEGRDIADLVLRRVDRLPPTGVELLEAASVLGQGFDLAAIEHMLEWPADDTYKVLDGLVRHDLLREPASPDVRFEFAHTVVREQLYTRLTKVRRVAAHRRAADALEELANHGRPVPANDIARHHVEAATVGELDAALAWCQRASVEATERLAYEESGRWLDAGLDLLRRLHPGDEERYLDLLIQRSVASLRAGERGTRRRFLEAAETARRTGDTGRLISVALAFDRGFFATLGRPDEQRIELLNDALSVATVTPSERACLLALLASELTWGDPDESRFDLSDEALQLARASGDPPSLIRVLSLRPPTIWSPEMLAQVAATVDELGTLTVGSDDRVLRGRYLTYRFGALAESGHFADLPAVVDELNANSWFLRLATALWHGSLLRANLALFAGRLDEARSLAEESLEWGRRAGQHEAMFFSAAIELEVRRLRGGLDEMLPQLEMGRGGAAAGGYSATRFLYEAGHATAAREDYSSAVRRPLAVPRTINGGPTLVNLSYLATRFEDVARASELFDLLEPYGGRFFQAIATHHVTDHYRGMLAATTGRLDEAAALLSVAVDVQQRAGAPLLATESRLEWARLSLLDPQWSGPEPTAVVDEAVATAERCGASALVQRATELRGRL